MCLESVGQHADGGEGVHAGGFIHTQNDVIAPIGLFQSSHNDVVAIHRQKAAALGQAAAVESFKSSGQGLIQQGRSLNGAGLAEVAIVGISE